MKDLGERHIESYEAIQCLAENGLLDEEEKAVHEHNLLATIISDLRDGDL